MEILKVQPLKLPEIKVIRYKRYVDNRGYFTETYRKIDFKNNASLEFLHNINFIQCNESFSKKGTIRGLHFQWNPHLGKLIRTLHGRLIDLALDIRKDSPNFGKIIAYDLPSGQNCNYGDWIWIPPGFAHGGVFPEDTVIEYFCTDIYNPKCEASISPVSVDIDWSLCDENLKNEFDKIAESNILIKDKDKNGFSINEWKKAQDAANFPYKTQG
jgi:dTDP-4-dehydrorhamnose 3,5-epimerase